MFDTLLIANRGEIACRVIRSAEALGLRTVAVYSDADRTAPHVRMADEAVRLGPAPAAESYLRADAVLEAALATGAGAIHPGYGFLSENTAFAAAVEKAGLAFAAPRPPSWRFSAPSTRHGTRRSRRACPCCPAAGSSPTRRRHCARPDRPATR